MISKPLLLTYFILLTFNYAFSQKLYIWCPEEPTVKPRTGFLDNQEVILVLFDGRSISPKSKVECESVEVERALTEFIQKAYPSCKFTLLPEGEYYKPSAKDKITIKIGIASYQAAFGTDISIGIGSVGGKFSYGVFPKGEWNGLVSYYVQIFDNRKEPFRKLSKEVSEITSKSNLWGYKTAKSCLFSSYDKANQTLLSFIEESFME